MFRVIIREIVRLEEICVMTITKTVNGNEATLAIEGWLDTQAAPELLTELNHLEGNIDHLVMDFSGLEYMSSTGLRAVVVAHEKMKGNLVINNASSRILKIFKTTGIDKFVKLV